MKELSCKHCNGQINVGDKHCPHCGIPLPADLGKTPQKTFIRWFIALVIFCIVMILWLPPDWSHFMDKQ